MTDYIQPDRQREMTEDAYKEGETLISRHGDRVSEEEGDEFELELQGPRSETSPSPSRNVSGPSKGRAHCYVIMAAIMASLGGILFGYDVGIISGAVLQLRDVFCLSCLDQELVISAMLMGAVLGSLTGGFFIDKFGRRLTIIVNAGVFFVGAIVLTVSPNFAVLVVGRVLVGFAVSVSATSECIYISEIAPAHRRGLLVSLNELGITLGLLLAYLCNYLLINVSSGWRWMFGLSALPAVIQGLGMCFLPKSPRYLMLKKQETEAEGVLQKLRGTARVGKELNGIRTTLASERESGCIDLCSSDDGMRGRMMVGVGLVFFQQFTGQPNVLYYAPTIFEEIGFKSDSAATLATLGLGIVKVIMTVIALLIVDKVGRRKLLMSGAIIMGASIFTLGIVCHFEKANAPSKACMDNSLCQDESDNSATTTYSPYANNSTPNTSTNTSLTPDQGSFNPYSNITSPNNSLTTNVSSSSSNVDSKNLTYTNLADSSSLETNNASGINVDIDDTKGSNSNSTNKDSSDDDKHSFIQRIVGFIALMCYVAAYGFSFGPVVWLVLSEIFPAAVKGRAIALATVCNWGTNLVVTFTFLHIMKALGVTWTFTMFGIICAFSVIFIFSFVPETKNKTLEQISVEMKTRPPLRRMRQNFGTLLCCISRQQALHITGNYTRVKSETMT